MDEFKNEDNAAEAPIYEQYRLNLAALPFATIAPLHCTRTIGAVQCAEYYTAVARMRVGRPLTQEEVQSIAFHHLNVLAQSNIALREIAFPTAYLVWRGRKEPLPLLHAATLRFSVS